MANRHSLFWRKPGRRDAERKSFARLLAEVEKIRQRDGLTQKAMAKEIGVLPMVLRGWIKGGVIARAESIAKLEELVKTSVTDHRYW